MENTEIVKKTDVGLNDFNLTHDLVKQNYDYNELTETIKDSIANIFDNYLSIGLSLKIMKEQKLYLANDYKSIIEYANKEFNYQLQQQTILYLFQKG